MPMSLALDFLESFALFSGGLCLKSHAADAHLVGILRDCSGVWAANKMAFY